MSKFRTTPRQVQHCFTLQPFTPAAPTLNRIFYAFSNQGGFTGIAENYHRFPVNTL